MIYNDKINNSIDIIKKNTITSGEISLSSSISDIDLAVVIPLINDMYGSEVELKDAEKAITVWDLISYWDDTLMFSLNQAISILQECAGRDERVRLYNSINYIELDMDHAISLLNDLYGAKVSNDDVKDAIDVREFLSFWDESLSYPYIKAVHILEQCSKTEDIRLYNSLSYIELDIQKSTNLLNGLYSAQIEYSDVNKSCSVKEYLSKWDDYLRNQNHKALEIVQRCADTNKRVRLNNKLSEIKLNILECVSLLKGFTYGQGEFDEVKGSTTVEELLSLWEKELKTKRRRHLLPKNKKENEETEELSHNPFVWISGFITVIYLLSRIFPNSRLLNDLVNTILSHYSYLKWGQNAFSLFDPHSWGNLFWEFIAYVFNIDLTPEVSTNAGGFSTTFKLIFLFILILVSLLSISILLSLSIGEKKSDVMNRECISRQMFLSSFLITGLLVFTGCLVCDNYSRAFFIRLIILFWMVYALGYCEVCGLLRIHKFKNNIFNVISLQMTLTVINFSWIYYISHS